MAGAGAAVSERRESAGEEEAPIQPPIDSESWCRTKVSEDVKHTFAWTIERFSERQEPNSQFLWSSKFTIRGPDEMVTHWKMKLYPKGDTPEASGYLSVYLSNQTETEVKARYEFTILDVSRNKQNRVKSTFTQFKAKPDSWGFRKFISTDFLKSRSAQWLPDDNLTIVCDVSIIGAERTLSGSKYPEECVKGMKPKHKCHKQLSQDLETAFLNRDFADVKVACGDRVFECHQFMLSARSPVFRAMFQADMTEAASKRVDIQDLASDVVNDMLVYIYTGNTPNLSRVAGELLGAADKYQLEQLKALCEERLCSSLEIGNCVTYLVLGDMYQAHQLKRMALSFVVKNMSSVVRSKDWKERLICQPSLMAEVMEAMARKEAGESMVNKRPMPGPSNGQGGSEDGQAGAKRPKCSVAGPIRLFPN